MDANEFCQEFAATISMGEPPVLTVESRLADLGDMWDSMAAIMAITMISERYGVDIDGDDLRKAVTVGDVLALAESRKEGGS